MRTSALLVSTLLYAGVIAHPFHVHHKRDESRLVNEYKKDNTIVREYEVVHKVFVPQSSENPSSGGQPQVEQDAPPPPEQPKKVIKHVRPNSGKGRTAPKKETQDDDKPTPVVQKPKTEPPPPEQPEPQQPQREEPKPKEEEKPSSSGNKDLDTFNRMRAQWNPSLASSPYTWSDKLYQNIKKTVQVNCGGGAQMVHKLYDGSMGQVLAESDGDFEKALEMWMCEKMHGPFCKKQTFGIGANPQGHAEIIEDTDKKNVACYWENRVYGCDFA